MSKRHSHKTVSGIPGAVHSAKVMGMYDDLCPYVGQSVSYYQIRSTHSFGNIIHYVTPDVIILHVIPRIDILQFSSTRHDRHFEAVTSWKRPLKQVISSIDELLIGGYVSDAEG